MNRDLVVRNMSGSNKCLVTNAALKTVSVNNDIHHIFMSWDVSIVCIFFLFSSDSVSQRRSSRSGNLTHWLTGSMADSERNLLCLSESTSMTTKWHQVSPKWSQMIPKWSQIIPRWSQMTPMVSQMNHWSQLIPSRSCRPLVLFSSV